MHREVFTERNFYTQKLLCREVSARGGFTHRSEAFTHRGCNIGEFIHREACAHRSLATEELCDVAKTQFYPRFWGLTFISCQRVAREISKSQLYDSFYRSTFVSCERRASEVSNLPAALLMQQLVSTSNSFFRRGIFTQRSF